MNRQSALTCGGSVLLHAGIVTAAGLALLVHPLVAQQPEVPVDSGVGITLAAFVDCVLDGHPDARIASLTAEQARDELFSARGAWEPMLRVAWERKRSSGLEYYDDGVAALTFPTPLGADLKLGFERASGRYLNAERTNLEQGQFTLGFSVPLTRGIATDERRRRLTIARARLEGAEADRAVQLAQLAREAARDYGAWLEASRREAIAREGVRLAALRLDAVRAGWEIGDLAGIDTIDARAELRRREALVLEAEAARFAAERRVETRLWDARGGPVALPAGWRPVSTIPRLTVAVATAESIVLAAGRAHPEVRRARARVREASAERLFAAQRLLPGLYLDASALAPGRTARALGTPEPVAENHKIGASVEFAPLLIMERGRVSAAGAFEDRAAESATLAARLAEARTRIALNDLDVLDRTAELQRLVIGDTRALLDAERFRFEAGETTLLVLTLRERALLDEETRLAALEARLAAAWGDLAVAIGSAQVIARYGTNEGR